MSKEKILIVEDDEVTSMHLKMALKKLSYDVVAIAQDSFQARNKIKIYESETSETQYWIEVIVTAKWLSRKQLKIEYEECSEWLAIFTSIGKSM